jgi:EAL domain-containing protein (putative c-di-GMP-specific phosphodiesterase class I)
MTIVSHALENAGLTDQERNVYGAHHASTMAPLHETLKGLAVRIANHFCEALSLGSSREVIESLSDDHRSRFALEQALHLVAVADPQLTATAHRTAARKFGRECAILNVNFPDIIPAHDTLIEVLEKQCDQVIPGGALSLVRRRLAFDLAHQFEAYQQLRADHDQLLDRLGTLAAETESYNDLMAGTVELLSGNEDLAGCWVGRPDSRGRFRIEFASEGPVGRYLSELDATATRPATQDTGNIGHGPSGRSWRSSKIERCLNFETDVRMQTWRGAALRSGLRSSASIPLGRQSATPLAALTLYSNFPGGFSSIDQARFIVQLQAILGVAIARIAKQQRFSDAVSYAARERWAALVRSDALEMHYQPLLDLRSGQVTKVEALARLRDGAEIFSPAAFLSALSSDDYFELYVGGLRQALSQRNIWLANGIALDISVNVPVSALYDRRYFDATRLGLQDYSCDPHSLTLEILETDQLPPDRDISSALAEYKALGVKLSEDDLGSGYSSLNRLRDLPFDAIKIDRTIVSVADEDAGKALRFVYQLTRLGHSLGKTVIVEGVEDEDMLCAIATLGADAVQGYAIAHPMAAKQFSEWLENRSGHGMIDAPRGPSRLTVLAKLLVWEERLHMLEQDKRAFAYVVTSFRRLPNDNSVAQPTDSSPDDCPLLRFFTEIGPFHQQESATPRRLPIVEAALLNGLHSPSYQAARDELVAAVANPDRAKQID